MERAHFLDDKFSRVTTAFSRIYMRLIRLGLRFASIVTGRDTAMHILLRFMGGAESEIIYGSLSGKDIFGNRGDQKLDGLRKFLQGRHKM